jgi:protein phosphatase
MLRLRPSCVTEVVRAYEPLLTHGASEFTKEGGSLLLPAFPARTLKNLCTCAISHLRRWGSLVQLRPPVYIVGDIHGNLFDFLRIFVMAKAPPASQFLVLGDYVDRGEFSLEVITLLLALMIYYPGNVIPLRGNHEFTCVNEAYGFLDDVRCAYGSSDLHAAFNEVFTWMPIAATVGDQFFCVHGGLSPALTSLAVVEAIQKPITDFTSQLISDLVWSDPAQDIAMFESSIRGNGNRFGADALAAFLKKTGMRAVIRAHQCVANGVEGFAGNSLYTVFSSSNYETSTNRCGLLFVAPNGDVQAFSLPPGAKISRSDVMFAQHGSDADRAAGHIFRPLSVRLSSNPTRSASTPPLASARRVGTP